MSNCLYIHIPFCRCKCHYCDFYSIPYQKDTAYEYINVLRGQIKKLGSDFSAIYIGGGTPTILEKRILKKLLYSLKDISRKAVEFTIEANPESLDEEKIDLFFDYGVNRLSIGVQSFNESKLRKLGRIHSVKQALDAVALSEKKIKNISIDLIFGVWEETSRDWHKELEEAVKLPIKHISVYALTYEKNTPLFRKIKRKEFVPLSDDISAKMYKFSMEYLPKNDFFHYEISNFSKKGFECKHNFNYWKNGSYIGLGPSAVSFQRGVRQKNISNLEVYIKKILTGESPSIFKEKLSLKRRAKESAAIKIRTKEGIDFEDFRKNTGFDLLKLQGDSVKELRRKRFLKYNKGRRRICLTEKGFLFCDTVSSYLLR